MPPDQREQDAEREKEEKISPCVPHAERLRGRTPGQGRRRTSQRRESRMEFDPPCTRGNQTRASVRSERDNGETGEIEDESQEQDFAGQRQGVTAGPMTVQPKEQPTGSDAQARDKDRIGKTAIRKNHVEKLAEHIGHGLPLFDRVGGAPTGPTPCAIAAL
jgi:hypothetical protein